MWTLVAQNIVSTRLGKIRMVENPIATLPVTRDFRVTELTLVRGTFTDLLILRARSTGEETPPLPITREAAHVARRLG